MFKNWMTKKLLKAQMKDVPEAEQEKMLKLVEENPDLFKRLATDMQSKMKEGKDQMTAAMEIARENHDVLKEVSKNR